jgi:hypothetical protein
MSPLLIGQERLNVEAGSRGGATLDRLSSLIDWQPIGALLSMPTTPSSGRLAELDTSKNLLPARRSADSPTRIGARMTMGRQSGFFDVEERRRELPAKGVDLERIAALVDFIMFHAELERAVPPAAIVHDLTGAVKRRICGLLHAKLVRGQEEALPKAARAHAIFSAPDELPDLIQKRWFRLFAPRRASP